jgi:hypothetical protein
VKNGEKHGEIRRITMDRVEESKTETVLSHHACDARISLVDVRGIKREEHYTRRYCNEYGTYCERSKTRKRVIFLAEREDSKSI